MRDEAREVVDDLTESLVEVINMHIERPDGRLARCEFAMRDAIRLIGKLSRGLEGESSER
jgi:hypothetical protein